MMKSKGIDLGAQLNEAFKASEDGNEMEALGVKTASEVPSQPAVSPTATKTVEEKPKVVTQVIEETKEVPQAKNPIATTIMDSATIISVESINKVINVYTDYLNMDPTVQKTTRAFLQVTEDSPSKVVYSVLNSTKSDMIGLNDLVDLRVMDGVTRAFTLMELDNTRLSKLDELVTMFAKEYSQTHNMATEKVKFCKSLEKGISFIPEKALEHLAPISELLKKGR